MGFSKGVGRWKKGAGGLRIYVRVIRVVDQEYRLHKERSESREVAWWPSAYDAVLPLQGGQVQSLVQGTKILQILHATCSGQNK